MTGTRKQRAVFLDRDGVLIRTAVRDGVPHPVDRVENVEILPGVREALCLLAERGLAGIVVTNQPDVRRGSQTREAVDEINEYLLRELSLTAVFTCYHDDVDACTCRKPKPGLLLQAAEAYDLDVARSFLVGDRWRDVGAGEAAGCMTFLVGCDYSEAGRCRPDYIVNDLSHAAQQILEFVR